MNPRIRLQCFQILGVPSNANLIEIKQAYRRLVHKYHPDSGSRSVEQYKRIQEAYSTLRSLIEKQYSKRLFNTPKESYHFSVSKRPKPQILVSDPKFKYSQKFNDINFNPQKPRGSRFSDQENEWSFKRKLNDPNIVNLTTSAIRERLKCSSNRYVRYEAMRILTFRKGSQSFDAILKTAFDPDVPVREKARQHIRIYIELHGAVVIRQLWTRQTVKERLKTIILLENMKYREVLRYMNDYLNIEQSFLKSRISRALTR